MAGAARQGDHISGFVAHHNGHIIGWTGGKNPQPIYCSGHAVTGVITNTSTISNANGKPIAKVSDTGTTNCPCCGRGFTIVEGSSSVNAAGSRAARVGDRVDIHGAGTGTIIEGSTDVSIGG